MADGVSDMITRIRNAVRNESPFVNVLDSKLNLSILEAVKREGYIWSYEAPPETKGVIRVALKYALVGIFVFPELDR